eukprot:gene18906-20809_t
MDLIFHEKQEAGLCAQHCLNSLLQGPYYTAVDLANFAHQLDEAEKERMREGGVDTKEFLKFMQQPSNNMNDTGFFSIQVICKALQVWGIDLIPFSSPGASMIRQQPVNEKAFICNLQQHWFTIRKLGLQWFNLDSVLSGPELITDTYLGLFLAQVESDGYSIFVVNGNLQPCEADVYLKHNPVSKDEFRKSKEQRVKPSATAATKQPEKSTEPAKLADPEEVRKKRMQYFERMQAGTSNSSGAANCADTSTKKEQQGIKFANIPFVEDELADTEEEMLKKALELSMKQT